MSVVVDPVIARLKTIDGVVGLHDDAEAFDYACSKARADAIDRILVDVVETRGWSLGDDDVLSRVTVEQDGKTRARILVDGEAATPWWQDRVVVGATEITWRFEPRER